MFTQVFTALVSGAGAAIPLVVSLFFGEGRKIRMRGNA